MFRQDLTRPFERVMGCSPAELLSWLPRALPGARLEIESRSDGGCCRASFDDGHLLIEWRILEPREIALLKIPQVGVSFSYSGIDISNRTIIQTHFDRATQRGGG